MGSAAGADAPGLVHGAGALAGLAGGVGAGGLARSSFGLDAAGSAANQRCLARMRARFGAEALPNLCWESAYFQMHLFAEAFRQSGSDHINDVLPYLLGSEFDAPQGRVRIDPANHHTCLYPRIGRANRQGGFTIVREATRPVVPDPYLVTHSCGDWTARLDTLEG
ncbi:MAG: transporter substrate-binding protein [Lautropia sp.]|nr:transporter substrate-binding protein [Lautropia sp.]